MITATINKIEIFKFSKTSDLSNWRVVNDRVMGGKSNGSFALDEMGLGVFKGDVSTKNNGGFSYLRFQFNKISISNFNAIKIKVKGDGKRYQFRLKPSRFIQESYISYFETNGEWQTIEIPLSELYPTFRGKKLELPNFNGDFIGEIGFLIGNKKNEDFRLEVDSILLE